MSAAYIQVHFRLDFLSWKQTLWLVTRLLPREQSDLVKEQSDLEPYRLQFRLPKIISRWENRWICATTLPPSTETEFMAINSIINDFCHLLLYLHMFLGRLYCKQYEPWSDCSLWGQSDQGSHSLLPWKNLVLSACEYMQQTLKADNIFRTKKILPAQGLTQSKDL